MTRILQRIDPRLNAVPYLSEYYGPWLVRERDGRALHDAAENLNIQFHLQQVNIGQGGAAEQARPTERFLASPEGVAVIELCGMLMKQESSLTVSTSTVEVRRQIRAAARSKEVAAIVLLIDSPGGTASGTSDLAAEVRRARAEKPVVAYIEDLGASAAYWVASQADEIVLNQPDALVGSLGTYLVVTDSSEEQKQKGRKVHVIRTGPFKGAGVPGTQVTAEQLDVFQEEVDEINAAFKDGVRSGRGLSKKQTDELFTGRVWSGREAQALGLVDRIETFDSLLARLSQSENPAANSRTLKRKSVNNPEPSMSEKTESAKPEAATIKEIKQHCQGADAEFILAMQEEGATLTECMSRWIDKQSEKLAKAEADKKAAVEEAKKSAAKEETAAERARRRGLGTTSLADDAESVVANDYDGEAVGTMLAARDQIMRERKCSAAEAMKILNRRDPELLAAANSEYEAEFAGVYRS